MITMASPVSSDTQGWHQASQSHLRLASVIRRDVDRRMRRAKTPRLHNPLARQQLDLSALHSTTEDGEGITFAIGNLGPLASCGAEQAAAGEQLTLVALLVRGELCPRGCRTGFRG